jgi:hypothetical protein
VTGSGGRDGGPALFDDGQGVSQQTFASFTRPIAPRRFVGNPAMNEFTIKGWKPFDMRDDTYAVCDQ